MTDLETQVEALAGSSTWCEDYQPIVPRRYGNDGLVICRKCEKSYRSHLIHDVLASLTSLVQEKAELARENFVMAGERSFILGNDIPETIERARLVLLNRATAAEARLAAVEQEREALTAIVEDFALRDFTVGRYSHGERVNVPQPDGSFRRYVKADIDAVLTPSRRDE